jgi:CheY-specific phosphatase CheX
MKAEHVNAFLVPAIDVIRKMAKVEVKIGKISRLDSAELVTDHQLGILIGVKGYLSGSVILSSSDGVARGLAGSIVKTEAAEITDSDLRDIISELANTIVGNATGALYELGIKAGITPPTVVLGDGISFRFDSGMDTVRIPLLMSLGEMQMTVSLTRENP